MVVNVGFAFGEGDSRVQWRTMIYLPIPSIWPKIHDIGKLSLGALGEFATFFYIFKYFASNSRLIRRQISEGKLHVQYFVVFFSYASSLNFAHFPNTFKYIRLILHCDQIL
jgi:hypothetical protein